MYDKPFVRPVRTHSVAAEMQVTPPGALLTSYDDTANEPVEVGGRHETVADALPGEATTPVGAPMAMGSGAEGTATPDPCTSIETKGAPAQGHN